MKAPLPANEIERLQALYELGILDSPREQKFDDIVAIAAMICDVPTALITLVDANRQWFKSSIGIEGTETERDVAFCAHTIFQPDKVMVIDDASQDQRFYDNPLVSDEPHIRFYAGAPLVTSDGAALGALCVVDYRPRQLTQEQEKALAALARQVMHLFNLRAANQTLQRDATNLQIVSNSVPVLIGQLDEQQRYVFCNNKYQEWYGITPAHMLGKTPRMVFGESLADVVAVNMARCYAGESLNFEIEQMSGRVLHVNYVPRQDNGTIIGMFIVAADITERKQHESALNNERERLAAIITGANVGTWEFNMQTGAANFNKRWAEILGYSLDELTPLSFSTWLSLIHSEDLPHARKLLQQHFNGESDYYDCKYRMRHKFGQWVWIRAHGRVSSRIDDDKPLLVFGTHMDVTALVESRRALEENEERFRSMLSNLPGVVYRCANDSYWTMHFLSDEMQQLTGYPASDFIGSQRYSFTDIMHPEDIPEVARLMREAIHQRQGFVAQYRIQHADGCLRWLQEAGRGIFDEAGQLKYLDGFIWDITEREEINNVMRVKEKKLSSLYHMVPVAIALHNFYSGRLIDGNPELFRMTGYSESEMKELDYWDVTPRSYEREEHEQMTALKETGRYGPYEKHCVHKDGHLIPVLANGVLVESESGELHIWSIIQDITERKRIEQMKNEFVSAVSHELRTPLTSISGALKLIVSGALGEIPEKSKTMLDIAHKNSQRLTLLINDLLDMEKLLAGKMTFSLSVQPLWPLLERAVYENRTYADQFQVTLRLCDPVVDVNVRIDEKRFLQVMANLLSNAAKFSPAGANVDIAVQQIGNQVRIAVVDRGAGIPLEFQQRLFQKFSQADSSDSRQKGGTGLGLAISKELLEHMEGSISFESRIGEGTRFYIDLALH